MSDVNGTGRFPMPTISWVTRQIPAELVPLFGFRGERIPDEYHDTIEYLYTIEYPDGTPYRMPILVEYIGDQEAPTVAFIVGDTIELNGIPVTVKSWDRGEIPPSGRLNGYAYHQVTVALPVEAGSDG